MRIKTITCHDVYNAGASLQAFALQKYLEQLGHDVEIINYKPDYLSKHYSLTAVNNPKYDKPIIRELYCLAKLKSRLAARKSLKKQAFDAFTEDYLHVTKEKYHSAEELKKNCPSGDLYIAGSDQIWNPLFPNGKDPAFFLDFVPDNKMKISYAASFATDSLSQEDKNRMHPLLTRLNEKSVREAQAVELLNQMGLHGIHVCDPVLLMDSDFWKSIAKYTHKEKKYIFYYDFDNNAEAKSIVREYSERMGFDILSAFPSDGMIHCADMGPLEFLGYILHAEMVVTNSYHAILFSVIFHKPFHVFLRNESINSRINDILQSLDIKSETCFLKQIGNNDYSWPDIDNKVLSIRERSKQFLKKCILETDAICK